MMSEAAGLMTKATGMSSATVADGPMPGSTPTTVPRKHPVRQESRFAPPRLLANPLNSSPIISMGFPSARSQPRRQQDQLDVEQVPEHHPDREGGAHRDGHVDHPL